MKARSAPKTKRTKKPQNKVWDLKLYVSDQTPKSAKAFANLKRICKEHSEHKYHISKIDIEQSPRLAKENDIVVVPTLIKTFPLPMRRVIGDLSDTGRVLAGLDLRPAI